MTLTLKAKPLTAAAFAPFGAVITANPATAFDINDGFTTRNHALATADCDGPVILSIFQGRVRALTVQMLECHPLGSQAFMPLGGQQWLVVVAKSPKPEACELFLCQGTQGVQYNRGVWHHPLLVIKQPQDFLVMDRGGEGVNLEEIFFDTTINLSL